MGLMSGEWAFPSGSAPTLPLIANGLRAATRLQVLVDGAGRSSRLILPKLGQSLFDWRITDDCVAAYSFLPAHPYVWENLDAMLTRAGGRISGDQTGWRPLPANAGLRRPWEVLTRRQRLLLRIPTVAALRPLDQLLPRV